MSDVAMIERQVQDLLAAMVNGQTLRLDELLDPRLQWVHGSGAADTKASLLGRLGAGAQTYNALDASDLSSLVGAGFAVTTGVVYIDTVRDGKRATARSRFITVWELDGDRATLLAWQTTRLPTPGAEH
jgi:hypothetical protein